MCGRGLGIGGLLVVVPLASLFSYSGCSNVHNEFEGKPKPWVMASFTPLYCFATTVAGPDGTVMCLLDGAGPHDYQPTVRDTIKLNHAQLFLVNGLDLDDTFAAKLKDGAGNRNLKLVKVGDCIPRKMLRKFDPDHGHSHDHGHGHHHHHHGEFDPHVWLGIPEAKLMVECIRDELKRLNPPAAKAYAERAADYVARLDKIEAKGKKLLADKKEKKIITFHDSLSYLARSLGLEVVSSIQPMAGEDPNLVRLKKLVELCQKQKVRVIAVEPNQLNKTAADTLLEQLRGRGVDAEIIEIDIMENVPVGQLTPDYYEKKMTENITTLAKALR